LTYLDQRAVLILSYLDLSRPEEVPGHGGLQE